jgi:hypothetical protein
MSTEKNVLLRTPRYYQITVEGKIDPSWADWLGGMQICSRKEADEMTVTTLSGAIVDQTALRGIMNKLWDLNLALRSIQQINPTSESRYEEISK